MAHKNRALSKSAIVASWLFRGGLIVGLSAGAANATIISVGDVSPGGLGPGDATVSSILSIGAQAFTGSTAPGTLTVDNGSTLTATDTVGSPSGFDGARIFVGSGGTGQLNVNSGGTVNIATTPSSVSNNAILQISTSASAPIPASAAGSVVIDDATLNVNGGGFGGINVGVNGVGTLMVQNGGTADITASNPGAFSRLTVGVGNFGPAGSGTATVTGVGSSIQAGGFRLGRDVGASGTLNVEDGGTAMAQDFIRVGQDGGSGVAIVTGAGSVLTTAGNVTVGGTDGSTGLVVVTDSGVLNAGGVVVDAGGTLTGAGGTVNGAVTVQNGGILAPGSSPGTMIINGDLEIDTGVLELEVEGGVSDQIQVSGAVNIGPDAIINLVFDTLPVSVDIDAFFTSALPTYDSGFDGSGIFAFVSNPAQVGEAIDIFFDGAQSPLTITSQLAQTSVSAPGASVILLIGLAGLGYARRKRAA